MSKSREASGGNSRRPTIGRELILETAVLATRTTFGARCWKTHGVSSLPKKEKGPRVAKEKRRLVNSSRSAPFPYERQPFDKSTTKDLWLNTVLAGWREECTVNAKIQPLRPCLDAYPSIIDPAAAMGWKSHWRKASNLWEFLTRWIEYTNRRISRIPRLGRTTLFTIPDFLRLYIYSFIYLFICLFLLCYSRWSISFVREFVQPETSKNTLYPYTLLAAQSRDDRLERRSVYELYPGRWKIPTWS